MTAYQRIAVGHGHASVLPDMDFETYSEAGLEWNGEKWAKPAGAPPSKTGLAIVGAHRYAEHPSTEVLSLKYDLKDGRGIRFWKPGLPNPQDLFDCVAAGGLIEAWNCGFERKIWNLCCVPKYGWPPLPLRSQRCAMAKSRAYGGPGSLDVAGEAFNVDVRKNKDGTRLLNKFSTPRKPTKKDPRFRIRPEEDPVDGPKLYEYNETDILAEAAVSARCPDLEGEELEYWLCDQTINDRGVAVDSRAIEDCIVVLDQARARYDHEVAYLTGGTVSATSEVQKLIGWLGAYGVHVFSLDDDAITEALSREGLPEVCRRVLEIRQMMSSASVKKIYSMKHLTANDGRVHDLFTYHGARTGRDTGNDVQPQNLPKGGPYMRACSCCGHYSLADRDHCSWCLSPTLGGKEEWNRHHVAEAFTVLASRDLATVEYFFGSATTVISACLRGLLVAAPGHDLLCADYSAIEAVGLAMLAGEDWRQEVFRTHGKIYEMSASKISGIPFEEFLRHRAETGQHHKLRSSLGKVAELASGYGGGVNAWKQFGAEKHFANDDEIAAAIKGWRNASPAVVEFWGGQSRWRGGQRIMERYGIEGAAVNAIENPGTWFWCRQIGYYVYDDKLFCRLPSGRFLTYHQPRLTANGDRPGFSIEFSGYNTNPKMGPVGWVRLRTYGGRLVENIVQAACRDILRHAVVKLEAAGYAVVLRVHDEIVVEVPEGWGSVEEFVAIMSTMPDWAADWPVRASLAEAYREKRYRK